MCRKSKIIQGLAEGAPFGLEGEEAIVAGVGTAEIKLKGPGTLGVLNGLPEEESHSAETVEALIGTTVFVNEGILVSEGEDGGERLWALRGNPDAERGTETLQEIAEPIDGLRGKTVAAAGENGEPVELLEQGVGAPFLTAEMLAFGAMNFALNATLVETAKKSGELRAQIESLPNEGLSEPALGRSGGTGEIKEKRTKFDIAPALVGTGLLEPFEDGEERVRMVQERLAMVGKRQGNETRTGEPAFHAAEDEGVLQRSAGARGGAGERLVAVGLMQGTEPRGGVKDGARGMMGDKFVPAGVGRGIKGIDVHFREMFRWMRAVGEHRGGVRR